MPKKRQALVEFEDILGACNAVNYAADNQIYIAGHPAFVNYSTSQKISRPGDTDDSRGVNNVLLFTILNPIYSITTVREAGGGVGSCPGRVVPGWEWRGAAAPLTASLPLRRTCSTPSATPAAPCRGSSSSARTACRPWWNILPAAVVAGGEGRGLPRPVNSRSLLNGADV